MSPQKMAARGNESSQGLFDWKMSANVGYARVAVQVHLPGFRDVFRVYNLHNAQIQNRQITTRYLCLIITGVRSLPGLATTEIFQFSPTP